MLPIYIIWLKYYMQSTMAAYSKILPLTRHSPCVPQPLLLTHRFSEVSTQEHPIGVGIHRGMYVLWCAWQVLGYFLEEVAANWAEESFRSRRHPLLTSSHHVTVGPKARQSARPNSAPTICFLLIENLCLSSQQRSTLTSCIVPNLPFP